MNTQFRVCLFTHQSPPEGVGEAPEHLVLVLLDEVDEEGGEDEPEETDVDGRDQLLSVGVDHGAEQLPSAAPPVHPHHPEGVSGIIRYLLITCVCIANFFGKRFFLYNIQNS